MLPLSPPFSRHLFETPGPQGDLEVYFEPAHPDRGRTAVLCAPNPRAGGTMGHKVVHSAARALRVAGWHTLRFNYRGVGKSSGVHGTNGEERDDVACIIDFAAAHCADLGDEILVAGFSFGSWVGIPVGDQHPRVSRLVGIGLPLSIREFPYPRSSGEKPLLVVQGREDEFATTEAVESWVQQRPCETRVAWIPCGHFFHGHLKELEHVIVEFAGPATKGS